MNPTATNRLAGVFGNAPAGDAAAQLQAHPGVALFFGVMFMIGLAAGAAALTWIIVKRPRTAELAGRPWDAIHAIRIVMLLVALLGAYLTGLGILQQYRPDLAATDTFVAGAAAAQSAVFHWPILAFAGFCMVRRGIPLREAFGIDVRRLPANAGLGAALYPAVLPAVAAAAFLARLVLQRMGMDAEPQEVLRLMVDRGAGPMRFYLIALGIVIAPIAEEVLFRGIVFPVLIRHTGTAWALLASAGVFAALHMNLAAAAPLFVLGLAFGLAYLYTGSLAVPIVLHAVFNGVSIVVSHFMPDITG